MSTLRAAATYHVRVRLAGQQVAGDHLRDDVDRKLLAGHGVNEAAGDDVDGRDRNGEEETPDRETGAVDLGTKGFSKSYLAPASKVAASSLLQ